MASGVHMPEPQCLIENINGRLAVNPKALKLLSAIKQPLVVVAIVGLYRTGKSYLMNKLAGKNKGEWPQQTGLSPCWAPALPAGRTVRPGEDVRDEEEYRKLMYGSQLGGKKERSVSDTAPLFFPLGSP